MFGGLASRTALSLVAGLYFQSLTQSTRLAILLPLPVVSPDAPNLFVAAKGRRKLTARWNSICLSASGSLFRAREVISRNVEKGGTMKLQSKIATSVGLTLLLACVSFAEHVKTDYDHSANFGQYKTYSWEKVQTNDQLLVDRIKSAVNRALAAKGWTEVPSGGDVEVFAIETTQNQQTLDTFYNGFGGGRRWGGFGGFGDATTTVETYKVGTLVVDLFDAKTEKLIWRSSSSDTLSDKADKNTKNLDKGVNKMFQHFPPAPSTKH
jgi:uncharacterized protein DUF4136